MRLFWFAATATTLIWSNVALANTRICVSVQQKSWYKPGSFAGAAAAPAPAKPAEREVAVESTITPAQPPQETDTFAAEGRRPPRNTTPHEIDPTLHLRRMLEYEVTHEPGFVAVEDKCEQRITIELYQLESGWTVFARYSGTEREEKVDHAELDEFAELAQRVVFALLRNKPITHTITRENVLRADSEQNLRTINGTGHLLFGMGTSMRVANLPTAQTRDTQAASETRFITPVSIQIGYRRKLRAWGLDAFGRLNLGTESTGVHSNDLGGHVDYSKSGLLGLHFLHYTDAPGVNSFYYGGGAAFEIAQFQVIRPVAQRTFESRDSLVGGGDRKSVV